MRAGKKQQGKLVVAQNDALLDRKLDRKHPPKKSFCGPIKFMWATFLRSFPGTEAHKLLLGAQMGIFGGLIDSRESAH